MIIWLPMLLVSLELKEGIGVALMDVIEYCDSDF